MSLADFVQEIEQNHRCSERKNQEKRLAEISKAFEKISTPDYWPGLARRATIFEKRFRSDKTLESEYFYRKIQIEVELSDLKFNVYKKILDQNRINAEDEEALRQIELEEQKAEAELRIMDELAFGDQGRLIEPRLIGK